MSKDDLFTRDKIQARALLQANRLQEAKAMYAAICAVDRRDADSWFLLGAINGRLGDAKAAEDCFRQTIALKSTHAQAYYNLGIALRDQGRLQEAADSFRAALRSKPGYSEAHDNLGLVLLGLGKAQEAISVFRHASQQRPTDPYIHANLANAFYLAGQLEDAVASLRKATALQPGNSDFQDSLGVMFSYQGRYEEAEICHRRALQLKPGNAAAHSNLLLTLHYKPDTDSTTLFSEHRRWAETHGQITASRPSSHANNPYPGKRLRVGYVSADFRNHSVSFFLEPLLENRESAASEIFCYSDVEHADSTTERLRRLADHWRCITGMSHAQVCDLIRSDGIDILVDLAGHTGKNRLPVFSHKPSPVQISYLGYPNTTGLTTMDYRLTDAWADPPGLTDHLYTESLLRLANGFLCYQPHSDAPDVAPPPFQKSGFVTFGSFNNLSKVNPGVINIWSRILHAIPDSRIVLKFHWFSDMATRERYYNLFIGNGIDRNRVKLLAGVPSTATHLGQYSLMDIALDTFPYNGTTTSCEALWMGVPVITMEGTVHMSRVGTSLLSQCGLSENIAATPDDYVKLATQLANDKERLTKYRLTMRDRIASSPLCDAKAFSQKVNQAYRTAWRNWCNKRLASV